MPCFNPLVAYRSHAPNGAKHVKSGLPVLQFSRDPGALEKPIGYTDLYTERLRLPCGKCDGCRLKKASEWALRCTHEARYHKQSSFLTLTYATDQLPPNGSLSTDHFQLFMKRLRERLRERGIDGLKYYMCGEYGDRTHRPHYHAILFGFMPEDRYRVNNNPGTKDPLWRSAFLEEVWSHGRVLVGEVTQASASYVARYTMKKLYGQEAEREYVQAGKVPPFTRMSKGIGGRYLDDFQHEIYQHDNILREDNMEPVSVPRYYDKRRAKNEAEWQKQRQSQPTNSTPNSQVNQPTNSAGGVQPPDSITNDIVSVKRRRSQNAALMDPRENGPERLAVRAEVLKARIRSLRRS